MGDRTLSAEEAAPKFDFVRFIVAKGIDYVEPQHRHRFDRRTRKDLKPRWTGNAVAMRLPPEG